MSEDENQPTINILNNCLNKEIKEIYVTGYSEIRNKFNFFSTIDWWYYIEFEDFFLCISSSQSRGMLQLFIHQEILCNFDLQENDVFTVATINKETYLGQKIVRCDLIYGNFDPELLALGIQFEDNRYLHKDNKYVFFDSSTFDGIEVGDLSDRDNLLEDERFYMESIIG